MQITVRQIRIEDAPSFRDCLDAVARERRFLAQVEALPLTQMEEFVQRSVETDAAQYVTVAAGRVLGWCDVFAHWAYALRHVGTLGMGVHADYRRQGLGEGLLRATLGHALRNGIYRVTLEARADNAAAIRLYEKVGFRPEARTRCALRFDDVFYDGVQMALLQGPVAAG
ncbi:MAG: GNAT family N-acetyltransferase [Betaproteobacteria bacterium]